MINNIKIGPRLALAFGSTIFLLLFVCIIAITRMSAIQNNFDYSQSHNIPIYELSTHLRREQYLALIAARRVEESPAQRLARYSQADDDFQTTLSSMQKQHLDSAESALLQRIAAIHSELQGLLHDALTRSTNDPRYAQDLRNSDGLIAQVDSTLNQLVAHEKSVIAEAFAQSSVLYHGAFVTMIAIAIVSILLSLILATLITKSILRPMNQAVRVADAIASGDLTTDIRHEGRDETSKLLQAMDTMQQKLRRLVDQLREIVGHANAGNFDVAMDAKGMAGFQLELASGINELMQTVNRGLNEVVRVLAALAKGDLTEKITSDYQGLFKKLRDDANLTVESLTSLILQIRQAVETVNTAAREIAAGNANLSQRTEEQASSLEETASSMEELTSTVKQNTDNARQANELAVSASDIASKGGEVVDEVVRTMASINESARRIVDIITVIDGIAFQTNILALNAAVEAARAGEQGRGFAVVAGEVRNLAQRSAEAAKEIKGLIGNSVEKVDAGTKLVDQAGKTMTEVVDAVRRVTDIMAEIASASREQLTGIEQVNLAVTQMDQVTQQNAALVEEAAAAAASLEEQAQNLVGAISVFRLDGQLGTTIPPARKPAPVKAAQATNGHGKRAGSDGRHAKAAGSAPAALRTIVADDGDNEEEWQSF